MLLGLAVAAAYLGGYGVLRSRHTITHHSNASHWDPEKRSPGHFLHATCKNRAVDKVIAAVFYPPMRMEEVFHNSRRSTATTGYKVITTMWDKVVPVLRSIHGEQWRPLAAGDGVVTEIPWRQDKAK
jgi:hypothetical protein